MNRPRIGFKKATFMVRADSLNKGWLITFNDMITLILTFFVLILSMSDMDKPSIDQISQSVSEAFGVGGIRKPLVTPRTAEPSPDRGQIQADRNPDMTRMAIQIASLPGMEAQTTPGGIRITMNEKVLFAPDSDVLSENSRQVLLALAPVLNTSDALITVEGHTDNRPAEGVRFPSNWELSTARAVSVVTFLAESGGVAPERLSAVGYGDTRPRAANDDEKNRQMNRRVEIKLKFQK
ncbi:MAG: flagellar motor protein MotB [Syntrophales bacterium]|jgi:chemotaxis protein MotB|nr:flagellar motor protein MotB [Syntrophales bacterium]